MNTLAVVLSVLTFIISILLMIIILNTKKEANNHNLSEVIIKIYSELETNSRKIAELDSQLQTNVFQINQNFSSELSRMSQEIATSQSNQRSELSQAISLIHKAVDDANMSIFQTLTSRLEDIQKENSRALEMIRSNVEEKLSATLTAGLDNSFAQVSVQLGEVGKSLGEMKTLSDGVTSLNRLFTNVKSRGTWAEVNLENILLQTIPSTMFERNFNPNPKKSEIVEFAIKIPNDSGDIIYMPLDSKFPISDYLKLIEFSDVGDKDGVDLARKNLKKRILEQAKDISKYINVPCTTPFAVMFLPTEGLYLEAVNIDGLLEECKEKYNIMLAGPSTINAMLCSINLAYRSIAINKHADEIEKTLCIVKSEYDKFKSILEKIKTYLDKASDGLGSAMSKNESIHKKLKNVEDIDTDNL